MSANRREAFVLFPFDPTTCLLVAAVIMALSGVPGLLLDAPVSGQRIAIASVVAASLLGESGVIALLSGYQGSTCRIDWPLPFGPAFLSVDLLSALFLLPLFLVAGCASLYSAAYWPAREKSGAGKLSLFSGFFAASMIIVLMARHGILFLMAWEAMSLSAYFLLTTDQQNPETHRSGTVYLITAHTGVIALFVLFSLLRTTHGTYLFPASWTISQAVPAASLMLITALIGFGGKAGLMPLHFWLPGAHANAPSHVSAMMSGVMLKMGVYGILRTMSFFDALPEWLGWLVLLLGAWSAVNGIALAASQRDLKRLLACSSIENIGIIFIGIGLGVVGQQINAPYLVICGFLGAFIHIINHGIFKSLLFLGSGALIHGTGTRSIDRMGGLARRMPVTSPLMLLGCIAICGLPPLNGFAGELFLYIGAITDGITNPLPLATLVAPLLALTGGIALVTFVKLYGIIFLGTPRTAEASRSHDPAWSMTAPMILLATGCLVTGVAPLLLVRLVTPSIVFFTGHSISEIARITGPIPLAPLTTVNILLLLLVVVIGIACLLKVRTTHRSYGATWGCGYPEPAPRMQYTGASFSITTVNLLGVIAAPLIRRPRLTTLFPSAGARFDYTESETVLDRFLTPFCQQAGFVFSYLRKVQHGQLHIYILYVFATLCILMLCPA